MTTSAGALTRLLSIAVHHNNPSDKFAKVVADRLSLEGDDCETQAILRLHYLITQVHKDIEQLPFDDARKKRLKTFITPLNGLHNFSQSYVDIATAKNNFLKGDVISGLMNIDDALSGNVDYRDFDSKTKEFAEKLRTLRTEFSATDAPERLKRVVLKRLSQIASMIENLHVYGADAIQEELEALVGAILVNPPDRSTKAYQVSKRIAIACGVIFLALPQIDASLGAAKSLPGSVTELIGLFDEVASKGDTGDQETAKED
jgi:hypothetical protein